MLVIPAVDIKGGKCVRLWQGRFDRETVYYEDPLLVAKKWEEEGAKWIHVVDLDGAREGRVVNEEVIKRILKQVKAKVQLGGGIRDLEAIEKWLGYGASRVVLGTRAIEDPKFLKEALERFGEGMALSLDVKDGQLMLDGWTRASHRPLEELLRELRDIGLSLLIYTDVKKDGTKTGPDFEGAKRVSRCGIPLILAGGISRMEHLEKASKIPGVIGVIIGRALYDGLIDLGQALRRFRG